MVSTRQSSNMGSHGTGATAQEVSEAGPSTRKQHTVMENSPSPINLTNLPVELLEKIFSYLDYNTIAHLRPVSFIIF